jgi:Na+/H+-dicarboxylate symporter
MTEASDSNQGRKLGLASKILYIPTNPFHALANGTLPGVVFFLVGLGVALIGIKSKTALIENVQIVLVAL